MGFGSHPAERVEPWLRGVSRKAVRLAYVVESGGVAGSAGMFLRFDIT
jgi:hypothetical protein